MRGGRRGGALVAAALLVVGPFGAAAQTVSRPGEARRMSAYWVDVPVRDVLRAFAAYSGASILASGNVATRITADINDQPWDVALQAILSVNGLVATEDEHGIIRVDNVADVTAREAIEPLVTRSYRISFSRATEIQAAIQPLLSARGSASVVESANTLVVTDIARVQRSVAGLIR